VDRVRLEDADAIRHLREDYLRSLSAPVDGMWESVVIGGAACWALHDHGRHAGCYWVDAEDMLLGIHLVSADDGEAAAIFRQVLDAHGIWQARASTGEPRYFALCRDAGRVEAVEHYLFRDHQRHTPTDTLDAGTFRKAERHERAAFERFYRENTAGDGAWISAFLDERLRHQELFGLYERGVLVATGECIPSRFQPPYADLGVVVACQQRGQGVGRSILVRLKDQCYAAGWEPICSCGATNGASKRAIEGAGFVSQHQIMRVVF